MLNNKTTSAVETRRKAHRRQHSTPNIDVSQIRKAPVAPAGIQRTQSHRGHRRGLSLDQHRSYQPAQRLTPTLGPISQDDSSYRNTSVAQSSLAQPGHLNFLPPGYLPNGLGLHGHEFPNHSHSPQHSHQFENLSPYARSPGAGSFNGMPLTPMTPAQQFASQPSLQQIEELERHIKAVYGSSQVHINVLPTPVSTPQKRASIAIADNLDVSPMPMPFENPDLTMNSSLFRQEPKFDPNERGYDSSFYTTPSQSTSCSPHQPDIKSFAVQNDMAQYPVSADMMYSSHTILADVDQPILAASGDNSMASSPRAMSLADLSIEGGTIEETGISSDEIQQFISPQDPNTHRWSCLFPGCGAKSFGRRENIRSHVQTHLGDRQYRCNSCGKCFVRQHDLKRHAKIHSGNKPYKCPCGGGFARQDALTRHRQRGMCIGAFPDAVRKQSKRGRPRKNRPDMEDRLDKAARSRQHARSSSNDESVCSAAEDSPSPPANLEQYELPKAATVTLMDLPEEDEEQDFGVNPSDLSNDNSPALSGHRFDLTITTDTAQGTTLDFSNLASSPGDDGSVMDPTSPFLPSTPLLEASGASFADAPTSPLCDSTSTAPPSDGVSIFDSFRLSTSDQVFTTAAEQFGLSFSSAGPTGMLSYNSMDMKNDLGDVGFHDPSDEAFDHWVMESVDFETVPMH